MANQQFTYVVDLVLCIDTTGSMSPIIDEVKERATSFEADLRAALNSVGKEISGLRARVVAYKDYLFDDEPITQSPFFELPSESTEFREFVSKLTPAGGGDEPESGLEALAVAIRSKWSPVGAKNRQVICVWTDASAHALEKGRAESKTAYPADMPANIDELTDLWEGQSSPMSAPAKRLLVFAPDSEMWNIVGQEWEQSIHIISQAGRGLEDHQLKAVLDTIANSI
ncbi:vWA domain-containing protein [Mycolicibacterium cosmeticum]|uniref:vWA domain-containing protein n=1 Tax=Mycolicibacterium cosmeticum TaxID=258533 RepID=UPI0032046BDD